MRDRRLAVALVVSLLLHLAAGFATRWGLPLRDDDEMTSVLEARLVSPPPPPPLPAAKLSPKPPEQPPALPRPARPTARSEPPVAAPAQDVGPQGGPLDSAEPADAQGGGATPSEPPVELAPGPAAALVPMEFPFPPAGRLRFAVTRAGGIEVGRAVHSWLIDGDRYRLRAVVETTGIVALFKPVRVVQESHGKVSADGFTPEAFRTEREGRQEELAEFDWNGRQVRFMGNRFSDAVLPDETQDLLSVFYQLSAFPPEVGDEFELSVVAGRKIYRRAFVALKEERLALRIGEMEALHIRVGEADGERIELWLAPKYQNLPVRIRVVDRKGGITDQEAVELEYPGVKLVAPEPTPPNR